MVPCDWKIIFLRGALRPTTCDDIYENEGFNHEQSKKKSRNGGKVSGLQESSNDLGVNDTQIDSIQYLNFAKKWFNSIFNSILFHKNSIQKII